MKSQFRAWCFSCWVLVVGGAAALAQTDGPQSQGNPPPPQQGPGARSGGRGARGNAAEPGVYKASITPHWFNNESNFWYVNTLRGGALEFILIDANKGTRQPAFDHAKLAAALSAASGRPYAGDHLPFTNIEFMDGGMSVQFDADGKTWKCDLDSYQCTNVPSSAGRSAPERDVQDVASADLAGEPEDYIPNEDGSEASLPPETQYLSPQQGPQASPQPAGGGARGNGGGRGGGLRRFGAARQSNSPDGQWTAIVSNANLYLRPATGGPATQLSQDGATNNYYSLLSWSGDSKTLVAWRVAPGDDGQCYLIESSPPNGGRAILSQRGYPQAGDQFTTYELNLFELGGATNQQIKPVVERVEYDGADETPFARWSRDGTHFTFEKEDRGHSRFRVIDVEARTGVLSNVVDEQAKTFIWTMNTDAFRGQLRVTTYLQQTEELIYASEQDGWRHLYLYDLKQARLENQITRGPWVVRGVDRIDEDNRQLWFEASGVVSGENPYYLHHYRINFDGSGLTALDEGNGTHTLAYSPDRKYLIDTYSRLDLPPVNNLRRVSDGKMVCALETADITELQATGWKPMETFAAKGRDGVTDIYGVIERPRNLDPSRKYPIIEDIYAGPQGTPGTTAPTAFTSRDSHAAYTANGFIVVKIDAMGTANRSKAFQDVCWRNLADAGFPDRILWIKAAAAQYSYMDTNRVGIFGTSAGGQSAAGAVIFHPEFYKAAAANSGCHDNRIDKSTWNEQWMGYLPHDQIWRRDPDNWYPRSSNIDNAEKLGGKLFLIVGELDHNVPPESTYRLVDALIKARKDFDLLVVPGADHGADSPITQRRTMDFFVQNLLGQAIPNRNAAARGGN